jgi:hypothetical protein
MTENATFILETLPGPSRGQRKRILWKQVSPFTWWYCLPDLRTVDWKIPGHSPGIPEAPKAGLKSHDLPSEWFVRDIVKAIEEAEKQ